MDDLWVVSSPLCALGQLDGPLLEADRIADALQVVQGGELDQHLAFALAELNPDPGLKAIREPVRQVIHPWCLHDWPDPDSGPLARPEQRLSVLDPLGEFLGHPNRQSLGHDPVGESFLLNGVLQ
jgi:hypothetical protein